MNITSPSAPEINIVNEAQNSPASPANELARADEERPAQAASPDVQVDVNTNNIPNQETQSQSSISNNQQAQQAVSNVVDLFQQKPELAVTAQGGRLSPEKAEAAVSALVGNQR